MSTNFFGTRLRETREERGLSLHNVAVHMGWSVTYISEIERGRRLPPSAEFIRRIAAFLDVKPRKFEIAACVDRGVVPVHGLQESEIARVYGLAAKFLAAHQTGAGGARKGAA